MLRGQELARTDLLPVLQPEEGAIAFVADISMHPQARAQLPHDRAITHLTAGAVADEHQLVFSPNPPRRQMIELRGDSIKPLKGRKRRRILPRKLFHKKLALVSRSRLGAFLRHDRLGEVEPEL